jgi:hypothetical protein
VCALEALPAGAGRHPHHGGIATGFTSRRLNFTLVSVKFPEEQVDELYCMPPSWINDRLGCTSGQFNDRCLPTILAFPTLGF